MRLYSSAISPFSARVRAALYYKQLPFEDLGVPAAGLKSAEFLAINPMGRIPVLLLDDGTAIAESETIVQYLEEAYPQAPLMPGAPKERAAVRSVIRVNENYVMPPMTRLFPHLYPTQRNDQVVADEVQRLRTGLGYLERFVSAGPYAYGAGLTLADCIVFPTLYLCEIIAAQLGFAPALQSTPRVAQYFERARTDIHLRRIYDEIEAALRAYQHTAAP